MKRHEIGVGYTHMSQPEPSPASPVRCIAPAQDRAPAQLALRRVRIDTYHENVAYLHRDCEIYRVEGFKALSKIEVRANGHSILATLNVVDDETIVACGQLGLSKAAFEQLE